MLSQDSRASGSREADLAVYRCLLEFETSLSCLVLGWGFVNPCMPRPRESNMTWAFKWQNAWYRYLKSPAVSASDAILISCNSSQLRCIEALNVVRAEIWRHVFRHLRRNRSQNAYERNAYSSYYACAALYIETSYTQVIGDMFLKRLSTLSQASSKGLWNRKPKYPAA